MNGSKWYNVSSRYEWTLIQALMEEMNQQAGERMEEADYNNCQGAHYSLKYRDNGK